MIKLIGEREFVFLQCQAVEQPIGILYSAVLPWQIIKKIAYVNSRIFVGYDDDGQEIYNGIQRNLSEQRKREIAQYITDPESTFPTAVLLNIPIEKVLRVPGTCQQPVHIENIDVEDIDQELRPILIGLTTNVAQDFVWLIFPHREGVAQIIDGQHRMSGFEFASQDLKFDLPVTFFLDQDVSAQAETFAVINGKQTRVTPSLVFDLFGISPQRNPYTVASKIVRSLNENDQSPLKETIKILGRSNSIYNGSFTQSTVAKAIIELMCGDVKQAEEDKRRIRKKEQLSELPTVTKKKAVLRKYFVDEKDEIIYKVLLNFFRAVSTVLSNEWNKPGSVLRKTIGFSALMKVMSQFIEDGIQQGTLSESYFSERLLPFANVNFDDVQLSSKGIRQLLKKFQ